MRRALFEAWRQTVDETDVIICLGDVTVGPANPPIDEALAALPGETILVAGNHDVAGGGKDYGFEAAYGVCAGFDAQGRDIGQLRERMAHFEGPPRADVRTDAPDRGASWPSLDVSRRSATGGVTGRRYTQVECPPGIVRLVVQQPPPHQKLLAHRNETWLQRLQPQRRCYCRAWTATRRFASGSMPQLASRQVEAPTITGAPALSEAETDRTAPGPPARPPNGRARRSACEARSARRHHFRGTARRSSDSIAPAGGRTREARRKSSCTLPPWGSAAADGQLVFGRALTATDGSLVFWQSIADSGRWRR